MKYVNPLSPNAAHQVLRLLSDADIQWALNWYTSQQSADANQSYRKAVRTHSGHSKGRFPDDSTRWLIIVLADFWLRATNRLPTVSRTRTKRQLPQNGFALFAQMFTEKYVWASRTRVKSRDDNATALEWALRRGLATWLLNYRAEIRARRSGFYTLGQ